MDNGLLAALIAAAAALVGIVVAGAVAVYQITKQARLRLKVDLYREILAAVETQADGERDLSTKLRVLNSLIGVWLSPQCYPGTPLPRPNTSWSELNELFHKSQSDAADLMLLIERWQIIEPRLDIFRLAFGVGLHDLREAWSPLGYTVGALVPPLEGLPAPPTPPKAALESIKSSAERVINAASKLSAWVADFQLEVQSLMLSDLFRNPLRHREPLDPEYFVVRLDRYAALKDYFENHTAWGQEMKNINERTRNLIAERRLG